MGLVHTLKFIARHPLNRKNPLGGWYRFFKWQIQSRVYSNPIICDFATKSKLLVENGMTGATQNIYCGLQEFEDMSFLLHFLRPQDLFVDVGANVGTYTVLAASEIGAYVHCFEPVPTTYQKLQRNIKLNEIEQFTTAHNAGLGASKSVIAFTQHAQDTTNHVAVQGEQHTVDVVVKTFDELFTIDKPTLVKIDTEGFEAAVLEGMKQALTNENLQAIIVELNGLAGRYGYSEDKIHSLIKENGFTPYEYHPIDRTFGKRETYNTHNTLYLRDVQFALSRVKNAPQRTIHNTTF